ncbi:hypothetical protein [Leeuwenhoekiella sp.]|uniref:hypothetical protein n=1 Tax=Leeuwenhoekiella sp. TaxID=1977054 RepID=UPI0032428832
MLRLTLPIKDSYNTLKGRVEDLIIPSEIIKDSRINLPKLEDNDKMFNDLEAIDDYLNDLERFTKQWYACRCDMFP